jgi:hypothetical protein
MPLSAQTAAPVPPIQDQPQPVMVTEPIQTQVTADQQPLTGGKEVGFGSWGERHSFLVPSIRFAETLQSNPLLLSNGNDSYRGFTSFAGEAQAVRYFGRDAEIRYAGGIRYDTYSELQGSEKFTSANDLLISKRFVFRNWQLLFDNETQYSKGSNFGGAGMQGLGGVVGQLWQWSGLSSMQLSSATLRPDVLPSQAIYTGRVGRVANSTLGEADFRLNARDIFTVAGTYSLLHFTNDLLIDTRQTSAIAGFNHNISARDSVAVEAMYTHFEFVDQPNTLNATAFSILYGRRLSGKLSVDFGAGPVLERVNVHDVGGTTHTTDVDWQGRAALQYRTPRSMFSIRAQRNFTAGGGVLDGAMTSLGEGTATYTLSRNWSSSVRFGVSRNEQLHSSGVYNTQYAGISFTRRLGFNVNLFASYDFDRQTNPSSCTATTCLYGGTRNVFGIGLSWTGKPISLQ